MMHQLKVRCPCHAQTRMEAGDGEPGAKRLRIEGCEWEGAYSDLLAQHALECPHFDVLCPQGCGTSVLRKELEDHFVVCSKSFLKCSICEKLIKPDLMTKHRQEKAELHVQFLDAKLQEKETMAGQERVLLDIQGRLASLEAASKTAAKTQHVTTIVSKHVISRL